MIIVSLAAACDDSPPDQCGPFALTDVSGRTCQGTTCATFQINCSPEASGCSAAGYAWTLGTNDAGVVALCAACKDSDGGITSMRVDCHDVSCADNSGCPLPVGYVCRQSRCVAP